MTLEQNQNSFNTEQLDEFIPLKMLERWFRFRWIVVCITLVGGLVGWGLHHLRPPIYEARIGFTVTYDLVNMGQVSQLEQDQASGAVGNLMIASDVLQAVVDRADEQGIAISVQELKASATLERQAQTWYIRIRQPNAQTAAAVGNVWGEIIDELLVQTYAEGIKAQSLQRYLESLEMCLQRSVVVEPVMNECSTSSLDELLGEMQTTGRLLTDARLASRGVLPSLLLDWTERAMVPDQPSHLGLGQFVAAGSLLGLITALILVETGYGERLPGRAGRA